MKLTEKQKKQKQKQKKNHWNSKLPASNVLEFIDKTILVKA